MQTHNRKSYYKNISITGRAYLTLYALQNLVTVLTNRKKGSKQYSVKVLQKWLN